MNIASSSSEDSDADIPLEWDFYDCFSLLVDSHYGTTTAARKSHIESSNSKETNNNEIQYHMAIRRVQTPSANRNEFCYKCNSTTTTPAATADDQLTNNYNYKKSTSAAAMTTSKSPKNEYELYKTYIPDKDNNIFDSDDDSELSAKLNDRNFVENLELKKEEASDLYRNTTNTYTICNTPPANTNITLSSVHRSHLANNNITGIPVVVSNDDGDYCHGDEGGEEIDEETTASANLDDDGLPEDDSWKDEQSSAEETDDNDNDSLHSINEESSKILYTIVEESCEESETYSSVPTKQLQQQLSTSNLEKYFYTLADSKQIANVCGEDTEEVDDFDESSEVSSAGSDGLDDSVNNDDDDYSADLQSSRLEKYFLTGITG